MSEAQTKAVINAISHMACYGDYHLWSEAACCVLIEGNLGLKEVVWC